MSNFRSEDGRSPLWIAANGGHLGVVSVIAEKVGRHGSKAADNDGVTPRMAAATNGHSEVEEYLRKAESKRASIWKAMAAGMGCVPKKQIEMDD